MKKNIISLSIGMLAGVIDVIPMIARGLDWHSNASAFAFWIVMGFVITHTSLRIKSWQKGLVIALVSAIPVMILVAKDDPKALLPMMIMSVILGSLVGFFTEKYAK